MSEALSSSLHRILAAPWQQRRNRKGVWMVVLIAALCCSAPVALFAWSLFEIPDLAASLRHGAAQSGRIAVVALVLAWWATVVANVLEQNHPTLARLVPNHAMQLRGALLAAWAALTALVSLAWYGDTPELLACAVIAASFMAVLAASLRWPIVCAVASLASCLVFWTPDSPEMAAGIVQHVWQAQRFTISAIAVAAAIVLLVLLIQDGGRHHAASYESRRNRLLRYQATARGERLVSKGRRSRLDGFLSAPYHAWMRHVLTSARNSPRSRTMLGLGPGAHWTSAAVVLVATVAAILGGVVLLELVARVFPVVGKYVPVLLSSVAIGAVFSLMSQALQVQSRLHQTHREQALLALLPGVPRAGALNRWLGWRMSGQFLLSWAGACAQMLLFGDLASHLGPPALVMFSGDTHAVVILSTLPLLALQWRRWARLAAPTQLSGIGPMLLGLGLAAVAFLGRMTGWFSPAEAGIAFALGALAWCALRWWRMGTEPGAFPVGRLGA